MKNKMFVVALFVTLASSQFAQAGPTITKVLKFNTLADEIAVTFGTPSFLAPFPADIPLLTDQPLVFTAEVLLHDGTTGAIVGTGTEMQELVVDPMGNPIKAFTTWTFQLTGQGTIFAHQEEDLSDLGTIVGEAAANGGSITYSPAKVVTSTISGTGVIPKDAGSRDFESIKKGTIVEVDNVNGLNLVTGALDSDTVITLTYKN